MTVKEWLPQAGENVGDVLWRGLWDAAAYELTVAINTRKALGQVEPNVPFTVTGVPATAIYGTARRMLATGEIEPVHEEIVAKLVAAGSPDVVHTLVYRNGQTHLAAVELDA